MGLVDGFENTTSMEALAGFVEQERGAWRGRRVGRGPGPLVPPALPSENEAFTKA